jgi:peptide/nickel transport system substrate-binding protein
MMNRITLFVLAIVLIMGLLFHGSVSAAPVPTKLVVAVTVEPQSLDPSLAIAGNDMTISQNFAEYLIYRTPGGELKPGLATSWKMASDGKKIEFSLRKGVKFHSGDPLTVQDVKFSFERAIQNPTVGTRLRSIEKVELLDQDRFAIHFKAPDATFIPNRGSVMIVSKSYYDRVGEEVFVKKPVGTGHYKFVHYVSGEYVDMERFDEYWGEKPSVKEARFLFVTEDMTRANKLKAGEADLIIACPYPLVKEFDKSPDFKVIRLEVNSPNESLAFANRNPNVPWHHRTVRQAMAHAIDWKSIIQHVLYGIPNHWMYLPPYDLGYDPSIKPYEYDPKKSRELLAKAGYPNGFDFSLYFYFSRTGGSREISEAVASYLEAVGIRTKLVGEEFAAGRARTRAAKAPNAVYAGMVNAGVGGTADPSYALQIFFKSDGANSLYSNPDLDKVISEAAATVDDTKRAELIKKAQRIIYEEVAVIPIYSYVANYVAKKNIDFTPTKKFQFDVVLVKDITVK